MFGSSQNQQQPQQNQNQFGQSTNIGAAATTSSSSINKQTKFQDLPDQARNLVEEME